MKDLIIIDNSPTAYMFQPHNAIPIPSWFEDPSDRELAKLVPILSKLAYIEDVRHSIKHFVIDDKVLFTRAN